MYFPFENHIWFIYFMLKKIFKMVWNQRDLSISIQFFRLSPNCIQWSFFPFTMKTLQGIAKYMITYGAQEGDIYWEDALGPWYKPYLQKSYCKGSFGTVIQV